MIIPGRRFRFGAFEFYPGPGDLFQQGRKIKIQNQVSQLLAVLLEGEGNLVSREDLQRVLWPGDTFVDFNRGLNKAVSGLRTALRDSALKPRFIETVARKGYRFIAAIETAGTHRACDRLRIDALAVLPLTNHSGDPAEEYFSDGMTEELISAVSRIGSLRVVSRTSAMRFKGTRKSLAAIARELSVDAVVEGSVARIGDKVRINAQLIYTAEDRHIWSAKFERTLCDVLELQAEIAGTIATQINRLLEPRTASPRGRVVHSEAYEAYLKANYFRDKMTPADLESSIKYYLRATDLDPAYAQAYAGLSQSYFFQALFGVAPPVESFPRAKLAALKALELDDTVTAAHNALAAVHILYDWDWARAEAACRRAIELSPGDPVARVHLADYMSIQGRHDEAIATFRKALAMDPISRVYLAHLGLILYRAHRYDQAIEQCRKALDVDSNYANAMWFMALSLEEKGQLAESILVLERAVEVSRGGKHYKALLGRATALAGERQRSLAVLAELELLATTEYVSPFDLALIHLGLGDRDSLFHLLEEAYSQRVFRLIELTCPLFDSIRSDPRCKEIVRRIGL